MLFIYNFQYIINTHAIYLYFSIYNTIELAQRLEGLYKDMEHTRRENLLVIIYFSRYIY
jgi:hypothetical protein